MAKRKAEAPETDVVKPSRRLRLGRYKSFRLERKKLAPAYEDRGLPSGWKLFKRSFKQLFKNWKLLGGILLIYGVLNLGLAGGFVDTDTLSNVKSSVQDTLGGPLGTVASGATVVTVLAMSGGGGSFSSATGAFQVLLFIIVCLALIYALRQLHAGKRPKLKLALYNAPAPLIPFLLVTAVVALELLPFVIGGGLFSTLLSNHIAITWLEQLPVFVIFFLMTLLSLYWVCGSVFAFYIVTLPDMTPVRALKSANELVRFRRVIVIRKLLALLIFLALIGIFIVAPVALTFPSAASPVFYVLFVVGLGLTQCYLYNLYRELIG